MPTGWEGLGRARRGGSMTPVPSSAGKRRRRSEESEGEVAGSHAPSVAPSLAGSTTGRRSLMDEVAWPATPVTTGAPSTYIATPTMSVVSPMQSLHHEESLLAANNTRERYKRELDGALERVRELATKLAGSEGREAALVREAAAHAQDLRKARDEAARLKALLEGATQGGADDSAEKWKQKADKLSKELAVARGEAEVLGLDLEATRKEIEMYKESADRGYREVSERIASFAAPSNEGGSGGQKELEDKLREFRILNKNLTASLEETKKEAGESSTLRREVESLRRERKDAEELLERNRKLSEMLSKATQEEAQVRSERDELAHWRVSLSIGMREQATPADVVAAFKKLRAENLELEQKCSALEERCRAAAQQCESLKEASASAKGELLTMGAKVSGLERDLIQERGAVERLKLRITDYELMEKSFKAEEVFVRDEEVKALQQKVAAMEQANKAQAEASAAELARARGETERVREAARKERDQALTAQTAANKAKCELQASLDQEKASAAAARTRAVENERVVRAKAVEADRNLKLKIAEIDKLNKAHADELAKVKSEGAEQKAAGDKALKDKEEVEKKMAKAALHYKQALAQARKSEDITRVWSALVGIHIGCTQKKAQDDKVAREYLVNVKNRLAEKQDTIFLSAAVPVEDTAALPKLTLQDNTIKHSTGTLPDLIAKHVTATLGTPSEYTGLPGLIAELVGQEVQRIVLATEAAAAAEEGGGEGAGGGEA